jgi:hypothetical protein
MFVGVVELALLASGIAVAGLWPTDSSLIFCVSVLLLSKVFSAKLRRPMGPLKEPGAHRTGRHRKRKRGNAVPSVANRRRGNARQHLGPFVRIEIGFVPGSRCRSASDVGASNADFVIMARGMADYDLTSRCPRGMPNRNSAHVGACVRRGGSPRFTPHETVEDS